MRARHEVSFLQVRGHCTFTCTERERSGERLVEVRGHCDPCVEEVRRRGYVLLFVRGDETGARRTTRRARVEQRVY